MKKYNINEMASIFLQAAKRSDVEGQLDLFEPKKPEKIEPPAVASRGVNIKDVFNEEIAKKRLGVNFPKKINYNQIEMKKIISKITKAFYAARERIVYQFNFVYLGKIMIEASQLEEFASSNQFQNMNPGETKTIDLPIVKLKHISIESGAIFESTNFKFKCTIQKNEVTDQQLETGGISDCTIWFVCA